MPASCPARLYHGRISRVAIWSTTELPRCPTAESIQCHRFTVQCAANVLHQARRVTQFSSAVISASFFSHQQNTAENAMTAQRRYFRNQIHESNQICFIQTDRQPAPSWVEKSRGGGRKLEFSDTQLQISNRGDYG